MKMIEFAIASLSLLGGALLAMATHELWGGPREQTYHLRIWGDDPPHYGYIEASWEEQDRGYAVWLEIDREPFDTKPEMRIQVQSVSPQRWQFNVNVGERYRAVIVRLPKDELAGTHWWP